MLVHSRPCFGALHTKGAGNSARGVLTPPNSLLASWHGAC
jgi:hypothetical protein